MSPSLVDWVQSSRVADAEFDAESDLGAANELYPDLSPTSRMSSVTARRDEPDHSLANLTEPTLDRCRECGVVVDQSAVPVEA